MKAKTKSPSAIHGLLFMTAKHAHAGVEQWFLKEKVGITPLQFGVLRSIPQEGATLNDLARRMMFKPPSILPSIDILERHGCLTRRNDPKDRRKIHLFATPKGKRILERVLGSKRFDPLGAAFKKMTAPKRKKLLSLLTELNEKILKSNW